MRADSNDIQVKIFANNIRVVHKVRINILIYEMCIYQVKMVLICVCVVAFVCPRLSNEQHAYIARV